MICEIIGVSEPQIFIFEIVDLFIFEIFDLFGKLESERAREGGGREREFVQCPFCQCTYRSIYIRLSTVPPSTVTVFMSYT